jgi:predicted ribosomally synthesized peptide with SipW-like signal peptide
MTAKKKRSSRDTRILIGALLIAGVIAGGSTFAWFTSRDEVTNRLSAKAEYNTSIVEDFEPPHDWTPGQEVNKDVSIVNTGSIDALVGVQLSGKFTIIGAGEGVTYSLNSTALPSDVKSAASLDAVTDGTSYALELSREAAAGAADEITTLQAGGTLIVEAGNPVDPANFSVRSGDDETDTNYSSDGEFVPTDSGVYIFRRTVKVTPKTVDGKETYEETYEYSGYLFVKGSGDVADKYYGFETKTETLSDGTTGATTPFLKGVTVTYNSDGKVTEVTGLKLATVKKSYEDATFVYDAANGKAVAKDADSKILVDIALANVAADGSAAWQYVEDKGFFYTDDLEAGATTAKLIDSVTLDPAVTGDAFLAMDFDLNVAHESVQVVMDGNNEAVPDGVKLFGVTPAATAATELANVSWSVAG